MRTGLELLGQVGDADAGGQGDASPARAQLAGYRPKDARLAAAIGAHNADPLTRLDLERHLGLDLGRPVGDAESLNSNHRHCRRSVSGMGIKPASGRLPSI